MCFLKVAVHNHHDLLVGYAKYIPAYTVLNSFLWEVSYIQQNLAITYSLGSKRKVCYSEGYIIVRWLHSRHVTGQEVHRRPCDFACQKYCRTGHWFHAVLSLLKGYFMYQEGHERGFNCPDNGKTMGHINAFHDLDWPAGVSRNLPILGKNGVHWKSTLYPGVGYDEVRYSKVLLYYQKRD